MLKRIALAAIAAIGFCGAASAQPAPVFNWSGFYIGETIGYGFGDNNHLNPQGGNTTPTFDIDGAVASIGIGHNWQAVGSQTVWGIEFDASYARIKGSVPTSASFGCLDGCVSEVKWFSTLRGRLGYAHDRMLLYATGGLAFGEVEGTILGGSTGSEIAFGWTVGAGIEFALSRSWSAKAEYLYVDLGDADYRSTPGAVLTVDNIHLNIVRLGLNYRW